jgi:endonuclease/exonuclease/phosphatase family metal-dependent hydrolase
LRAFFFLFALVSFSVQADVVVVTYNMAQLERFWVDFVPCTAERIGPQVDALLKNEDAPIHQEKHFVLLLQEVFKPAAYDRLNAEAKELGFKIFPATSAETEENGLVTITNLPVWETRFVPFTKDNFAQKGMLYTLLGTGGGYKFAVLNVHTVFSNTSVLNETHITQFQEVGKFIKANRQKSVPLILAGDFNAGPDMKYKEEFYPMAQTIWHRGLIPVIEEHQMKWVDYAGFTWDNANPLILYPAPIIKLMNLWEQGSTQWGLSNSKMDHVFVSDDLEVKHSQLVLNAPIDLKCSGRDALHNKGSLSDHYGLMVKIKFKN